MDINNLPLTIYSGKWKTGHVQGIAIDTAQKYIYLSFTQVLVKLDLDGNLIGTVKGLTGHLGDLAFNDADGRVYGSLEYKSRNSFYIAIFDVDKIDRVGLDAETDGIMTAVYLPEVVKDYSADMDGNGVFDGDKAETLDHRYGCSGIDGTTFGPSFITPEDGKMYLTVAYGIYKHLERDDNDYQILLQYDTEEFVKYAKPLNQLNMHREGPGKPVAKHFVYTGNTTYGIQNLEYDPASEVMLAAVYRGNKPQFLNPDMFFIDCKAQPEIKPLKGVGETGSTLSLSDLRGRTETITGSFFPHGSTGIASLGDGYFYIAQPYKNDAGFGGRIDLYRMDRENMTFVPVS